MDKKKNIYLIYEFLSEQGGLEREIINHARMLQEEGYEVKILTCHFDKRILNQLPFEGLKIESINRFHTKIESLNLILCFLGFNKLKKYNPVAFLSYSSPANFLVRNKNSKKINYINHYPHYLYLNWDEKKEWAKGTQGFKRWIVVACSIIFGNLLKKIDKSLIKKNDLIFMNSLFTKRKLNPIYSSFYKNEPIISYPPLDPKFSIPSNKKIKEKYIFSSSRIIPDKKYGWLIEALQYLRNKIPLYLAGSVEDSYKNELMSLAKKKGIKIKFLGRLNTNQIKEYYFNALIFAFPTPNEDFGLVPAEAMACGTPVVIWGDGAGPTEQVIDGVSGYYAKPYNLKDFANKIDLAIESKIKKKNRRKIILASKKFSYNAIKKDFIKEIKKIVL